jgi:uncharacterized protein YjiS (DUF1127 family)
MANHQSRFETNQFYEKLMNLRRTNRKAFEGISPASKLALAHYEQAKREAAELEAMRDELPPAA